MEKEIEKITNRIEEINRELLNYNEQNDAESIQRTKLQVEKFNLQRRLNEYLQRRAREESESKNKRAAEIRDQILKINEELEKYNEKNDAESIKRTELNVQKYNLQKELNQLLADGAELDWGEEPEQGGEDPERGEEPEQGGEDPEKGEEPEQEGEDPEKGEEPEQGGEDPEKGEEPEQGGEDPEKGEEPEQDEEDPEKGEEPEQDEEDPERDDEDMGVAKLGFFKKLALSIVLLMKKLCKEDGKMAKILTGWENKIKDSAVPLPAGRTRKPRAERNDDSREAEDEKPEQREEASEEQQRAEEIERMRQEERRVIADYERPQTEEEQVIDLPIWKIIDNDWLNEKLERAGEDELISRTKNSIARQIAERGMSEEKAREIIEARKIPRLEGKTDVDSLTIDLLRRSLLKGAYRNGIDLFETVDSDSRKRRSIEEIYTELELEIAKQKTSEVSRKATEEQDKPREKQDKNQKGGEPR